MPGLFSHDVCSHACDADSLFLKYDDRYGAVYDSLQS